MANFIVKGPFNVPMTKLQSKGKDIDKDRLESLKKECPTLEKPGCYVFSLQAGRGSKPLYVGKTTSQTILKEAFNDKNVLGIIRNLSHGTLQIWTITQIKKGRLPKKMIDEIEKMLIPWASERNPDLINKHHTKKSENWSIEGVVGPQRGPRGKTANDFRKMIGIGGQTQKVNKRPKSPKTSSPSSTPTKKSEQTVASSSSKRWFRG
ncbi:MAG: hypothetical protein OXF29_01560 [Hyphomicrobiales bacterium]|nr:hypothetical protein [Hyphomicrobiales bacterium]